MSGVAYNKNKEQDRIFIGIEFLQQRIGKMWANGFLEKEIIKEYSENLKSMVFLLEKC